ncbi:hypothetical protein PZB74_10880 [Porifericola rhodea]|uniref:hypothetical protein n=1 Tax=Porifericola rhodea TaxID=930972 RepID=UPI002665DB32|nr:hypothetical protein [Porifericola rhodea]WKN33827.1 hypothetical protein PZB74_10880 [Porifericola rhodea]
MKQLITVILLAFSSTLYAQSINRNWKSDLDTSLKEFMQCDDSENEAQCHKYTGASLKQVYKVNDFYASDKGRYMLVTEIYDFLQNSSQWTLLGRGYDQEALNSAQQHANANKAVVAVMKGKEYGHMVLILPGEVENSGSWNLQVPNSASFFTHQKEKSYINKKLSYAFTNSDQGHVLLYGRKY